MLLFNSKHKSRVFFQTFQPSTPCQTLPWPSTYSLFYTLILTLVTAPAASAANNTIKPQVGGNMFRVGFYSRYFDINTEEFLGKIVGALNPLNKSSVVAAHNDDDPTELYGFFWINATIVFFMFVSSTGANLLAQWLHAGEDDQRYVYDFRLLTVSIMVFYGYAVVVPVVLYVVTTWGLKFSDRLSVTRMISIYSYAGLFWIPATVINVMLAVFISNKKHHMILSVLQWVLVGLTGAVSGLSVILKVRPIIVKNIVHGSRVEGEPLDASLNADEPHTRGERTSMVVLGALGFAHFAFAVTVKVVFFGIQ